MSLVPHRTFGRLNLTGSVLGLGTVKWGRNQKVRYAPFELPSDAHLHQLLHTAETLGINVIDSAPAYGIAEERVGLILHGRRDRFILITKVGEEFVDGQSHYDFSRTALEQSIARSLKRLQTSTLDFVLLHCPPNDLDILQNSDALQTLADLKQRGWLRFFGASTMTTEGGLSALEHSDAIMVAWNIDYRAQESVIRKAGELGRAVFLKKALLSGNLTNPNPLGHVESRVRDCVQGALGLPQVSCLVAGTVNLEHLQENALATQPGA